MPEARGPYFQPHDIGKHLYRPTLFKIVSSHNSAQSKKSPTSVTFLADNTWQELVNTVNPLPVIMTEEPPNRNIRKLRCRYATA